MALSMKHIFKKVTVKINRHLFSCTVLAAMNQIYSRSHYA